MKIFKKSLVMILLVAFAFSLSGCFGLFSPPDDGGDGDSGGSGGTGGSGGSPSGPATVTISLIANGGSLSQSTIVGKEGEPLVLPVPTREGYTFYAWCTNGVTKFESTTFPSSNKTLYARYYATKDTVQTINFTKVTDVFKTTDTAYKRNVVFQMQHISSTEDKYEMQYLTRTPNIDDVKFEIKLDSYIKTIGAGQALGASGTIKLQSWDGSTDLDTVTVNKYSYTSYTLDATTNSNFIDFSTANTNLYIFKLQYSCLMGSSYIYMKNIEVKITFTEKQGTIV